VVLFLLFITMAKLQVESGFNQEIQQRILLIILFLKFDIRLN